MTKKFLLGIGVEKCGTTSLNDFFKNEKGFITPPQKETFFFNTHFDKGIDFYQQQYNQPWNSIGPTDFVVDITPSYFRKLETLNRIEQFDADKKYLICLRNPIRQAFSLYVHDLIFHYTKGQYSKNFERFVNSSFKSYFRRRYRYYFIRYAEKLEQIFSLLGREKCHVIILEKLLKDPSSHLAELANFLELKQEFSQTSLPHSNEAKIVPKFVSHSQSDNDLFSLSVKRGTNHSIIDGLTWPQVLNAYAMQGTYTLNIEVEYVEYLLQNFYSDDIKQTEELLDCDLQEWRVPKALNAPMAT